MGGALEHTGRLRFGWRFGWRVMALAGAIVALAGHAQSQIPNGPEFQVNSFTLGPQWASKIDADSNGGFVVVWHSYAQDGSSFGIYAQRFAVAGAPVGPELQVNTTTVGVQRFPDIAMTPAGDFVVAWEDDTLDGSSYGIFARRYDSTGTPLGAQFPVNTTTAGDQRYPSVAADGAGNFVVVWESDGQDGDRWGVFGQRFDTSGFPLGGEFRVNTVTADYQRAATVAADTTGNFVVVWSSYAQDGSLYGVFGQRYDATGSVVGGEMAINTVTADSQHYPNVEIAPNGQFVVAWQSYGQDGSDWGVFEQLFDASGTPIGVEQQVNTFTAGPQRRPAVAVDNDAAFLVTWHSDAQDGSESGVFAQCFNSVNVPAGTEFQVNTTTADFQDYPSITSRPGGFVVAWESYPDQDGDRAGVFGQRYAHALMSVSLDSFAIERTASGARATWRTLDENGTVGFQLRRSPDATLASAVPAGSFVAAHGSGSSYQSHDDGAPDSATWYFLEELTVSGIGDRFGPFELAAR